MRTRLLSAVAILSVLACDGGGTSPAQPDAPGASGAPALAVAPTTAGLSFCHGGEAVALRVSVPLVGIPTTDISRSSIDGCVDAQDADSLLSVSVGGVSADVARSSMQGRSTRTHARSIVSNLRIAVGGVVVTARTVEGTSDAICRLECTEYVPLAYPSARIEDLRVNGLQVIVTGAKNQRIPLSGGGELIIQERSGGVLGMAADPAVNSLHLIIPGVADVIVARAEAKIVCPVLPK